MAAGRPWFWERWSMPADQFKRKVEEIAAGKEGLIPGEYRDRLRRFARSPSDGLYGFDLRQHRWIEHKDLGPAAGESGR